MARYILLLLFFSRGWGDNNTGNIQSEVTENGGAPSYESPPPNGAPTYEDAKTYRAPTDYPPQFESPQASDTLSEQAPNTGYRKVPSSPVPLIESHLGPCNYTTEYGLCDMSIPMAVCIDARSTCDEEALKMTCTSIENICGAVVEEKCEEKCGEVSENNPLGNCHMVCELSRFWCIGMLRMSCLDVFGPQLNFDEENSTSPYSYDPIIEEKCEDKCGERSAELIDKCYLACELDLKYGVNPTTSPAPSAPVNESSELDEDLLCKALENVCRAAIEENCEKTFGDNDKDHLVCVFSQYLCVRLGIEVSCRKDFDEEQTSYDKSTPPYVAPTYGAPTYGAPTYEAPTYGAPPPYVAPTYGAPPPYVAPTYGAPPPNGAPTYGPPSPNESGAPPPNGDAATPAPSNTAKLKSRDCNYTTESLCGDSCIEQKQDCFCGETRLNILGQNEQCSVPISEDVQCSGFECPQGKVLNLKEVGKNGKCYNDYEDSYNKTLGPQAMFRCASGDQCVRVSSMCRGYSLCNDKSDLEQCNENLKCATNSWSNSTPHWLASGHHYCQYHDTDNDGKFDDIGRNDETNFDVNFAFGITLENIGECNSTKGLTAAFSCGKECIQNYEWCRNDRSFKCGNNKNSISSNNRKLCGLPTWSEVSCDIFNNNWGQERGSSGLLFRGLPAPIPDRYEWRNEEKFEIEYETVCEQECSDCPKICKQVARQVSHSISREVLIKEEEVLTAHGLRCSGKKQHCYYPWYNVLYTFDRKGALMTNCTDKSDQIFRDNGTPCKNFWDFRSMYRNKFCKPDKKGEPFYEENCGNIALDELRQKYQDFDPHNCQASCASPGPGCLACSNPAYFNCKRFNETVCLHPDLKCDGHQHCDQGEDEVFEDCYKTYIEKDEVEEYATLICPSKYYKNTTTVSTPCDGNEECRDSIDEQGCVNDNYASHISFFLIMLLFLGLRFKNLIMANFNKEIDKKVKVEIDLSVFFKKKKSNEINDIDKILELLDNSVNDETKYEDLNVCLLRVLHNSEKSTRKKIGEKVFTHLEKVIGKKSEIYNTLHKNFKHEVCNMIIDANKPPGCFVKNFQKLSTEYEKIEDYEDLTSYLLKVWEISSYIIDVYKDIFILVTMLSVAGGVGAAMSYPDKFPSVVIICSALTIIIPILISSIHLAINNPGIVFDKFDEKDPKKLLVMRIGIILLSFLNPVLIIKAYESMKQKIKQMLSEDHPDALEMLTKCKKVKKQYVDFIRIELGLETIYQTIGQILLILLARTLTATTSGFQIMFAQDNDTLKKIHQMWPDFGSFSTLTKIVFYLSIFLGLKSSVTQKVKGISVEKGFLEAQAKIVLHLWALFATLRKVVSLIVFFAPSMGLLNLLYHWKAEQVRFGAANKVNPLALVELFNMTEEIRWANISRWNQTNRDQPIPPPYTLYTGITLGGTFKAFLGIMAVHFILVTLVKIFTVKSFRGENPFNCFVDVLENMNVPSPFRDWDYGKGKDSVLIYCKYM